MISVKVYRLLRQLLDLYGDVEFHERIHVIIITRSQYTRREICGRKTLCPPHSSGVIPELIAYPKIVSSSFAVKPRLYRGELRPRNEAAFLSKSQDHHSANTSFISSPGSNMYSRSFMVDSPSYVLLSNALRPYAPASSYCRTSGF